MSGLGFRPLDAMADAALLHSWVRHPRSKFWGMGQATVAEVAQEYAALPESHRALLVLAADPARTPIGLAELYDPRHSPLRDLPELRPGDLGMHVLVAPPVGAPRPGFTRSVFAAVMTRCFADPTVARVVVEPDINNAAIGVLNAKAGFVVLREVELPDKTAALSVCTRRAFTESALSQESTP